MINVPEQSGQGILPYNIPSPFTQFPYEQMYKLPGRWMKSYFVLQETVQALLLLEKSMQASAPSFGGGYFLHSGAN